MSALTSHGHVLAACELLADLTVLTVVPDGQQPTSSTAARKAASGLRDTPAAGPDSSSVRLRQAVVRAVGQHIPRRAVPQRPVTAAAMLTEELLVSGSGHSLLLLQRDVPAEEAAAAQLLLEAQQEGDSGVQLSQFSGGSSGGASHKLQPPGLGGSKPCNREFKTTLLSRVCMPQAGCLQAASEVIEGLQCSSQPVHLALPVMHLHPFSWHQALSSCLSAGAASQSAAEQPTAGVEQQLRRLQVLAGCNMQSHIAQVIPGALGLTFSKQDLLRSHDRAAGHSTDNDGGSTTKNGCQPGAAGDGIGQEMPSAIYLTRDGSVGCVTRLTSEQLSGSLKQHPLKDSHDVVGASALEAWKSHETGTVPLNIHNLHYSGKPWPLSLQMNL